MSEWHSISHGVKIPIPDEYVLPALRLLLIEKLKIRMLLMTKVFDGGKEIRCPIQSRKQMDTRSEALTG